MSNFPKVVTLLRIRLQCCYHAVVKKMVCKLNQMKSQNSFEINHQTDNGKYAFTYFDIHRHVFLIFGL